MLPLIACELALKASLQAPAGMHYVSRMQLTLGGRQRFVLMSSGCRTTAVDRCSLAGPAVKCNHCSSTKPFSMECVVPARIAGGGEDH